VAVDGVQLAPVAPATGVPPSVKLTLLEYYCQLSVPLSSTLAVTVSGEAAASRM
jgi:hypothetical protein